MTAVTVVLGMFSYDDAFAFNFGIAICSSPPPSPVLFYSSGAVLGRNIRHGFSQTHDIRNAYCKFLIVPIVCSFTKIISILSLHVVKKSETKLTTSVLKKGIKHTRD